MIHHRRIPLSSPLQLQSHIKHRYRNRILHYRYLNCSQVVNIDSKHANSPLSQIKMHSHGKHQYKTGTFSYLTASTAVVFLKKNIATYTKILISCYFNCNHMVKIDTKQAISPLSTPQLQSHGKHRFGARMFLYLATSAEVTWRAAIHHR